MTEHEHETDHGTADETDHETDPEAATSERAADDKSDRDAGSGGRAAGVPGPPPSPAVPVPAVIDPAADAAARRNWAAAGHWTALAAAFLGGFAFLGPLVVWLVKRDQDRWVAAHAVEALNFQLTWFLGGIAATVVAVVLTVVTIGFALVALIPLAIVAFVAWVVLPIRGAVAASRAEDFHYPLTVRLVQV